MRLLPVGPEKKQQFDAFGIHGLLHPVAFEHHDCLAAGRPPPCFCCGSVAQAVGRRIRVVAQVPVAELCAHRTIRKADGRTLKKKEGVITEEARRRPTTLLRTSK